MNNKQIKDKRVLVTGGTGSFGKYITQFLLENGVREVVVFSRDEDKQYSMQFDFKKYKEKLRFFLGDVREIDSLMKATKGIDVIFHAAALKQIPSTEYNVIEAVKTNILGAQNVVDAAIANNVDKVVAISTDKAVEPINSMGFTKSLQERIIILGNKNRSKSKTKFALVRYGNVVASRGSVIPLFKKEIQNGEAVTITHKDMTRFILTLSQAIELVVTALTEMVGGEIFIPRIPPLRIIDLAEVMIDNLKPNNRKIVEIGLRPGEKLHETLISEMESVRAIKRKKYFILLPQIELKEISYTYKINLYKTNNLFRFSSNNQNLLDKKQIIEILKKDKVLV